MILGASRSRHDQIDPRLTIDGSHHLLLPAFFYTLRALHSAGRDFAVVLRTFGSDSGRFRTVDVGEGQSARGVVTLL